MVSFVSSAKGLEKWRTTCYSLSELNAAADGETERWDMDTIDRRILTILQENARTPLKVIAEQVFLSSPAVSARIERLEQAGYITGYQAQIS